jgi:hypothetical protein
MTYPYGTKGAPVVGNGLGGLPRRALPPPPPPPPPPAPVLQAVSPYYLNQIGQRVGYERFSYSPVVSTSNSYSDGNSSGLNFYFINSGSTFNYQENTFSNGNRQLKVTGNNASVWAINADSGGNLTRLYCLKHNLSGMVSLSGFGSYGQQIQNTACVETVNGVDNFYFMTSNNTITTLSRVIPDYAVQPTHEGNFSVTAQASFNHSTVNRRAIAIFLNGDNLFVLSIRTDATRRIHLDRFDKSTLAYVSTVYWNLSGSSFFPPGRGFIAETATTLAYRYELGSDANFERIFVLDKTTLSGYNFSNGIGGDASRYCNLYSDSREIYMVSGYGSGGGFGATSVRILRPDSVIDVASQTYNAATFSLGSSICASVPDGFSWNTFYNASGQQVQGRVQIFAPSPTRTFSYGGNGWAFSQSWGVNAISPTAGIAITDAPPGAANPYTANYAAFNPRGTNYVAP